MSSRPLIRSLSELVLHLSTAAQGDDVFVVGVCGMPGAGKSSLCESLVAVAPLHAVRLKGDLFSSLNHADRQAHIAAAHASTMEERIAEAENPANWYDFDGMVTAIKALQRHRHHTHARGWNSKTGNLDAPYTITLPSGGPAILLCDCIYLLHDPIRSALDLAIMVEVPSELVISRGLQRSRGDISRAAYMERLRQKYAVPYFDCYAHHADAVCPGNFDLYKE